MKEVLAIPRLGKPTPGLISELEKRSQPAILDGAALTWPAMQWTLEHLKNHYGEIKCPAYLNMPKNQALVNFYSKDFAVEITIADFIDKLASNVDACYIRQLPLHRAPELTKEFDFCDLTPKANYKQFMNFWLASANTRSTLHWDTPDNLLVQISGKKHALLFSPEQSKFLYPYEDQLRLSKFDPLNWEPEEYPDFAHAQPLGGTINAGEILFLPKRWWHFMYQGETSISLSNWYGDEISTGYFFHLAKNQSWQHLIKPLIDFVRLGVFGLNYNQRLSSDVPTGLYLYNLCKAAVSRRF